MIGWLVEIVYVLQKFLWQEIDTVAILCFMTLRCREWRSVFVGSHCSFHANAVSI